MKLEIDLWRIGAEIKVHAQFDFEGQKAQGFSFCLNKLLRIDDLLCDDQPAEYTVEDANQLYRSAKRIILHNACPTKKLILKYQGPLNGHHTVVSSDLLAINYYSAWYPSDMPEKICKTSVILHEAYDTVLFSEFNHERHTWKYTPPDDFDCNILAFRNNKEILGKDVNVFYYGHNDELAKGYSDAYTRAASFCVDLYKSPNLHSNNLCILPKGNAFDGYRRKQLIVLGEFTTDLESVQLLLVHEVAHTWCIGAEVNTWEDWLNETSAEWTALLYALRNNHVSLFEQRIARAKSRFRTLPPIKTADGSRPDGVHDKGVALFYDIFEKYNYETISELLRIFDKLQTKNTQAFISAVKNRGMFDIAEMILAGILL